MGVESWVVPEHAARARGRQARMGQGSWVVPDHAAGARSRPAQEREEVGSFRTTPQVRSAD